MSRRRLGRPLFVATCLAPALVLYVGLVAVPFVQTFQLSLFAFSGVSTRRQFVGIENFQRLWLSEPFWWALRNTATLVCVAGPVVLALSLWLAHVSVGRDRLARWVQAVCLVPNIISVVAVAMVWRGAYNPSTGLLAALGLPGPTDGWLGDLATSFPAVMVAYVWASLGFYTLLFTAGLKAIPAEVVEAANLEGVTEWRRFTLLTWPLIWSVRRVALIHLLISAVSVFALVNVMTDGAPSERTQVLLNYLYRLMTQQGEYGGAAAVGVVNVFVISAMSLTAWLMLRRNPEEGKA